MLDAVALRSLTLDDHRAARAARDRTGAPARPVALRHVITATGLELRAGTRILLADTTLRLHPATGSGSSAATAPARPPRCASSPARRCPTPAPSSAPRRSVYLPQDPREGDLNVTAKDRVLSARGLDALLAELEKTQIQMAELTDAAELAAATARYSRAEERFAQLGGWAAESEAARICSNLGLPDRVLGQRLNTLSGGQRRRVELARILFAASETAGGGGTGGIMLLLDEPTNHLDADSDRLAARLPPAVRRRPGDHLARRRSALRRREQGLVPRRRCAARSTPTT